MAETHANPGSLLYCSQGPSCGVREGRCPLTDGGVVYMWSLNQV